MTTAETGTAVNMAAWDGKILDIQAHGLSDEEVADCFTAEQATNFFRDYSAMLRKPATKYAVAVGNVVDGLQFYGLFDSELDAVASMDQEEVIIGRNRGKRDPWQVITVYPSDSM